jgi:hypothetical protein
MYIQPTQANSSLVRQPRRACKSKHQTSISPTPIRQAQMRASSNPVPPHTCVFSFCPTRPRLSSKLQDPLPSQDQHGRNNTRHQPHQTQPKTPTQPRALPALLLLAREPRPAARTMVSRACNRRPRPEDFARAAGEGYEGGRTQAGGVSAEGGIGLWEWEREWKWRSELQRGGVALVLM